MENERSSLALPKFAELVQKALSKDRAFIFVFIFWGEGGVGELGKWVCTLDAN